MTDFRRFRVWHEAVALAADVHALTRTLGPRRSAGLAGQLQRASTSIAACIAEGAAKPSGPEFARFLSMAAASCAEVEAHLELAEGIGCAPTGRIAPLLTRATILRRRVLALRREVVARSAAG